MNLRDHQKGLVITINQVCAEIRPLILVVGDRVEALLGSDAVAIERGFDLIFAGSGQEAVETAAEKEIALILINPQLLEMDGFATLSQFRERLGFMGTPVIFITAEERLSEREHRAYQLGAADFIYLPVDPDILEAKIRNLIALNRGKPLKEPLPRTDHFLEADSQMARLIRSKDWRDHPLGASHAWPGELKNSLSLMLNSGFPMFIAWGDDGAFFYNDAYIPVLGSKKHPCALGAKFKDVWSDIWRDLSPIAERVHRGESSYFEDLPLLMNRSGHFEQTYFTFSYSPIRNSASEVIGLFCACVETTKRKQFEVALTENEKRVIDVLESMGDAFIALDKDLSVLRVNRHQEKISGLSRTQTVGKNHWDIWPKESIPKIWDAYHKVIRDKVAVHIDEFNSALKIWLSVDAFPTGDGGIAAFFRDVTKEKAVAKIIEDRESQFRVLANTIPQLAWMANQTGDIYWYNDQWYEYTGTTFEEMQGWGWEQVHNPQLLPRMLPVWKASLETGKPWEDIFQLRSATGEYRWFLSRAQPIRNFEGVITGWFGTNTDIHDERESSEKLKESRERLDFALQAGNMGAWTINLATNEAVTSNELLKIFGVDELDKDVSTIIQQRMHPDDRDEVQRVLTAAIISQTPYKHEYRIVIPKTGAVRWILSQGRARCDSEGTPFELSGVVMDITDLVEQRTALEVSARELAAEKNKLENIFQSAPAAMALWKGEDLIFEKTNSKFDQIFGNRQLVGKAIIEALPELAGQGFDELLLKVMRSGTKFQATEMKALIQSEKDEPLNERFFDFSYIPVFNADGSIYGVYDHAVDVTDRVVTRDSLVAAKQEAINANNLKSSFLANMSHEIRTPLGAILGFSDLLKESDLAKADRDHYIGTIERNGKALTRLIDDILDLAKVEAGKLDVEDVEFSFFDLLGEATDLFREQAKKKNLPAT